MRLDNGELYLSKSEIDKIENYKELNENYYHTLKEMMYENGLNINDVYAICIDEDSSERNFDIVADILVDINGF